MPALKYLLPIVRYSLVICRNKHSKYLCVLQRNNKWWIPGGGVEVHETHAHGAVRETKEETGIDISLKGIITFDQLNFGGQRNISGYRVIYYAEPTDYQAVPKQTADHESIKAQYLSLQQILQLKPHWRVPEIYHYPKYIEQGGAVFPMSVFQQCNN